jgi:hypothetical protein
MGGGGITEYRSAGGVGLVTSFFKCCIDTRRDDFRALWLSATCTFAMPDFGFVASRLFSCSSLASNKAVDYRFSNEL